MDSSNLLSLNKFSKETEVYRNVDIALIIMPIAIVAFLISLTELIRGKNVLAASEVTTQEAANTLQGVALGDHKTSGKKRKRGGQKRVTERGARNGWRVEPTMFELHTPQLEKREVSSSQFSPNMFHIQIQLTSVLQA